jgi:hypothetical protein
MRKEKVKSSLLIMNLIKLYLTVGSMGRISEEEQYGKNINKNLTNLLLILYEPFTKRKSELPN